MFEIVEALCTSKVDQYLNVITNNDVITNITSLRINSY